MKLKPIRALLAMAGLAAAVAPAGATKYAGEFMKIPVGARAVGMGGAFSAVSDDATAPFWNPAGMVYLPYREAFLEHNEQFGNLENHNFGSMVWPMKSGDERRSAFGVSATWVGVDGIPITPRPSQLKPGDWLDYGTDNDPTTPGDGQLKFVHSSIPDTIPGQHVTSFGAGLDASLLYMPTDAVTLSAVMHDLTTT